VGEARPDKPAQFQKPKIRHGDFRGGGPRLQPAYGGARVYYFRRFGAHIYTYGIYQRLLHKRGAVFQFVRDAQRMVRGVQYDTAAAARRLAHSQLFSPAEISLLLQLRRKIRVFDTDFIAEPREDKQELGFYLDIAGLFRLDIIRDRFCHQFGFFAVRGVESIGKNRV